MVSSDGSIEDVKNENLEGEVYGTEYGIRQDTHGKVLGIPHGSSDRSKLGGSSLQKALGSEAGTKGL